MLNTAPLLHVEQANLISAELGSDHGMNPPMQNGAIQRMLLAFSESNVIYKVVPAVLLIGLLYNVMFKPEKRNLFPVWATIEIALISYIISSGGLSRRIL